MKKIIVCIVTLACLINCGYSQDETSIIITAPYNLPAGKRAIVTDYCLFKDAVEYAEKTVSGTLYRTAAPTKVKFGYLIIDGKIVNPSVGALVIDGPAYIYVSQITPNLLETLNGVSYTRILSEPINSPGVSVPYVSIKIEPIPNLTGPSLLPSNSIVIPDNTIGTVAVFLESSTDLVTWTAALPGDYSNTVSKRFFRIRATAK
jgi:hypothetical protein